MAGVVGEVVWAELARLRHALADRLGGLDEAQWEQGSWCPRGRVRDVLGHLVYLAEATRPSVLRDAVGNGVLPDRLVDRTARQLGAEPVPALVQRLRAGAGGRFHLWATPPAVALGEVLVHSADALRPPGVEPEVRPDGVAPVLAAYRRLGRLAFHGAPQRGLRLVATDLDWTTGQGPVVQGRAIDLLLLMANRGQVLPQLSGPGVARIEAGGGRRPNWVDRTQALWRVGNRIEAFQLRRLGASPMALLNRGELLVIETAGRRSGRPRVTPLGDWGDALGAGRQDRVPAAHPAGGPDGGEAEVEPGTVGVRRDADVVPVEHVLAQRRVPMGGRWRQRPRVEPVGGGEGEGEEGGTRVATVARPPAHLDLLGVGGVPHYEVVGRGVDGLA